MSSPKPNLGYRDAAAAIRFLVDAFGFEVVANYPQPDGTIAYAELQWPGGRSITLHTNKTHSIAAITSENYAEGNYPPFSVHVDTGKPDELFARATKAGARVIREVEDSPVGVRGFVVTDTEGLYWSFGTPLPVLKQNKVGLWKPGEPS